MASPEKIAPSLPETLPEDFNEWDREGSPAAEPVHSVECEAWEAAHTSSAGDSETFPPAKPANSREGWEAWLNAQSFGKSPKPLLPSAEREAFLSAMLDKPRDSWASFPPPVFAKPQRSTSQPVAGPPSRALHTLEASPAPNEVPAAPGLPQVAAPDELPNSPEPPEELRREANALILQLFPRTNPEVAQKKKPSREKKLSKKMRAIVPAVGACSLLIVLVLVISLGHHGPKDGTNRFGEPLPEVAGTSLETNLLKPAAGQPLNQDQTAATTEGQQTADESPANEEGDVNSAQIVTEMQAQMMNTQLSTPSIIPRDLTRQISESAPPPIGLGPAGPDGLAIQGAIPNVFNGRVQSVVQSVSSKPLAISSGIAAGMLIQKKVPVYPLAAKLARSSGTVQLHAIISRNGTIKDLRVISGPKLLQQAAIDAVRTWRYKPYLLDNEPVEIETTISVIFNLDE